MTMKKLFYALVICLMAFSFVRCEEDDEEKKSACLECVSTSEDVTIEGDFPICEGDSDPETGETITKADLEAAKSLFEAFGADCTLE